MRNYTIEELSSMTKEELCKVWANLDDKILYAELSEELRIKCHNTQRKINMRQDKWLLCEQLKRELFYCGKLIDEKGEQVNLVIYDPV